MKYPHDKHDLPGTYFPMPKSVFNLGLETGEIAVFTYLMYCEDRKTFQCHPSYATIGEALRMSKNTVRKYVRGLEHKGLIYTEPTMVKTHDGRNHNGSLLYTLKPLEPIEEAYFQKMITLQASRLAVQKGLEKFEKRMERKKKTYETITNQKP